MARQICQGGPGDTRLGAVLGDTRLSPGISSRCHLSDESRANGIVFPLCIYDQTPQTHTHCSLSFVSLLSRLPLSVFWQQWKAHTCYHAGSKMYCWLRAHVILEGGVKPRPRREEEDITSALHLRSQPPHVTPQPLPQNN